MHLRRGENGSKNPYNGGVFFRFLFIFGLCGVNVLSALGALDSGSEQEFSLGMKLFHAKDFSTAERHFAAALTIDQSDDRFHFMRGRALNRLGRAREAISECNQIRHSFADYAKVLKLRGDTYGMQGNWDKAKTDYESAQTLQADILMLDLADVYQRLKLYDKARNQRRLALRYGFASRPSQALKQASQMLLNKDSASAIKIAQAELIKNSGDLQARFFLASASMLNEDFENARKELDICCATGDLSWIFFYMRGVVDVSLGDTASALRDLNISEKLLLPADRSPPSEFDVGAALRWRKGIELKGRMRGLDTVLFGRAQCNKEAKNYKGAIADLTTLIVRAKDKTPWLLLFERGVCNYMADKYELALADFLNANRVCEKGSGALNLTWLAHTYEQLKQNKLAQSNYDEVVRLYPKDEDSYFIRSQFFWSTGQKQNAIRDLSTAIKLSSVEQELYYYELRAINYYETGQFLNALKDLDHIIESSENANVRRSMAYLERSFVLEKLHNATAAASDRVSFFSAEKAGAGFLGIGTDYSGKVVYIVPDGFTAKSKQVIIGDQVVAVNDAKTKGGAELLSQLRRYVPGGTTLSIKRGQRVFKFFVLSNIVRTK